MHEWITSKHMDDLLGATEVVTSDSGSMEQYILMHIMNSKAMHCQQKRFRLNGAVYIGADNAWKTIHCHQYTSYMQ